MIQKSEQGLHVHCSKVDNRVKNLVLQGGIYSYIRDHETRQSMHVHKPPPPPPSKVGNRVMGNTTRVDEKDLSRLHIDKQPLKYIFHETSDWAGE